jgi:hypothetical protein
MIRYEQYSLVANGKCWSVAFTSETWLMFLKGSACTLIAQTITSTSDHHHTLLMQSTMKILIILGLLLCYVYPSSALSRRDVTVDAFCSNLTAIETDLTKICRTTCLIRVSWKLRVPHQGREFIANGALENGAFCTVFSENFHKF